MARPREFDEPAAVRLMTGAFWARGYQATSIRDLEEVTGLATGSLYKAYGSKREIFRRCVEEYMESQSYLAILRRHDEVPLRDALRAVMDAAIESAREKDGRHPGCLVTNLAAELARVEPELGREAAGRLADMRAALRERLLRARLDGELGGECDVETLSAYLMAVLQGLLIIAASTRDIECMSQARDLALAVLD